MDALMAIKNSIQTAEMIGMSYLKDLSDEDFMLRPHAKCNHINWQVGHLITSENQMMSAIAADKMPTLPEGFAEKYTKEKAESNDPQNFATKEDLLSLYTSQRAATMEILADMSPEDLDKETGVEYAPTVGDMLLMQGAHWMMHCGQWVVVRRETDKPIVI